MTVGHKNESTAILLAFFLGILGLFGIGHLYVGVIGRGLLLFFAGLILEILGWISLEVVTEEEVVLILLALLLWAGVLAFWVWQIFDARAVCRQHNLQARGGL
jgi:TM2 domain-containing membrane protein YozV